MAAGWDPWGFALLAGALVLATALAVALPALRRGRAEGDRSEAALAIFRDQLSEVERDRARGLISGEEARAARTEIERRMLTTARARGPAPSRAGRAALLAAALAIPALGGGVYALIGAPGVASQPFAQREGERAAEAELAGLTRELRARLEADPAGGSMEGWLLLGGTHLRRGEHAEAARAFEAVTRREEAPAGALTQHAEALVGLEGGVVTPRARALIDRALERDPAIPAGHYYRALARAQADDPQGARAILLGRLAQASGVEPWAGAFLEEANQLGAALGEPALAARDAIPALAAIEAMDAEARAGMIRGMVDGLEARLEEAPEDLDGWLRLAQARATLGEGQAARAALSAALSLMPEGDPRREGIEAALAPTTP